MSPSSALVSLFVVLQNFKLTATGPSGLVAVKNLKEEGFNVTGFDRNSYIGGLWQFTAENQTSVMETTVVNISRERVGFSKIHTCLEWLLTKIRVALLIIHLVMVSESHGRYERTVNLIVVQTCPHILQHCRYRST